MEKVLSDHLNEIQIFLLLFGMRVESSVQQVCSVESKEAMKMLTVDVFNCEEIFYFSVYMKISIFQSLNCGGCNEDLIRNGTHNIPAFTQ